MVPTLIDKIDLGLFHDDLGTYKIGLLWCHSHVELRLIDVDVDLS